MSMIAPEALISCVKSFASCSLLEPTLRNIETKPNALPNRMARAGTWREFTAVSQRGASPLSAMANITRAVT